MKFDSTYALKMLIHVGHECWTSFKVELEPKFKK